MEEGSWEKMEDLSPRHGHQNLGNESPRSWIHPPLPGSHGTSKEGSGSSTASPEQAKDKGLVLLSMNAMLKKKRSWSAQLKEKNIVERSPLPGENYSPHIKLYHLTNGREVSESDELALRENRPRDDEAAVTAALARVGGAQLGATWEKGSFCEFCEQGSLCPQDRLVECSGRLEDTSPCLRSYHRECVPGRPLTAEELADDKTLWYCPSCRVARAVQAVREIRLDDGDNLVRGLFGHGQASTMSVPFGGRRLPPNAPEHFQVFLFEEGDGSSPWFRREVYGQPTIRAMVFDRFRPWHSQVSTLSDPEAKLEDLLMRCSMMGLSYALSDDRPFEFFDPMTQRRMVLARGMGKGAYFEDIFAGCRAQEVLGLCVCLNRWLERSSELSNIVVTTSNPEVRALLKCTYAFNERSGELSRGGGGQRAGRG